MTSVDLFPDPMPSEEDERNGKKETEERIENEFKRLGVPIVDYNPGHHNFHQSQLPLGRTDKLLIRGYCLNGTKHDWVYINHASKVFRIIESRYQKVSGSTDAKLPHLIDTLEATYEEWLLLLTGPGFRYKVRAKAGAMGRASQRGKVFECHEGDTRLRKMIELLVNTGKVE